MARNHVNNFPPGTYVEHVDKDWIGTVKRITVNAFGEPILIVDISRLCADEFTVVNDVVSIHPMYVRRLDEDTIVKNLNDNYQNN